MKVAASPQIYTGRCPKVVFKLQVTRHQSLGTPNPWPLIPSYQSRVTSPFSPFPKNDLTLPRPRAIVSSTKKALEQEE